MFRTRQGRRRSTSVLSNSFGFGGVNACLLFQKLAPDATPSPALTGFAPLRPLPRTHSYVFSNPALLNEALTHKSHVNELKSRAKT